METKEILIKFAHYFSRSNFLFDGIQGLGWLILQGLSWLVLQLEKGVDTFYSLLDITTEFGLKSFFTEFDLKIIISALITLSLLYIGVNLIIGRGDDMKVSKIPQNVLLFFVVALAIPTFFAGMNKITIVLRDAVGAGGDQLTNAMMADYLTDLKYLDSMGWDFAVKDDRIRTDTNKNYIAASANEGGKRAWLESINITERFDAESEEYKNKELFKSHVIYNDSNVATVEQFKQTKLDIFGLDFTSYYYRYQYDFLPCFVSLLCTGFALAFVCYKIIRVSFEIVAHKILLAPIAAASLSGQQKTVHIIKGIFAQYFALMITSIMLKLFYLLQAYIANSISNVVLQLVAMVVVTLAVIDGPHIVEQLFGVDAGIKSGFQTMLGAYHLGKGASGAIKGVGGAATALGGAIGDTAVRFAGAAGAISNHRGSSNNLSSAQQNSRASTVQSSQGGDQQNSSTRSNNPTSSAAHSTANSQQQYNQQQQSQQSSHQAMHTDQNQMDLRDTAHAGGDLTGNHANEASYARSAPFSEHNDPMSANGTAAAFGDGTNGTLFGHGMDAAKDDQARFPQTDELANHATPAVGGSELGGSSEHLNPPDANGGWSGRTSPDVDDDRKSFAREGQDLSSAPTRTSGGQRNLRDSETLNRNMGALRGQYGKLEQQQYRNQHASQTAPAERKSLPGRMRDSYRTGRQMQAVKQQMRGVKSEQKELKRPQK